MKAGNYTITYNFKDLEGKKNLFIKTQDIEVKRIRKVSLLQLEPINYVKAGQPIEARFVLKNEGNDTENFIIASKKANLTPKEITLAPGSVELIELKKETSPDLASANYQTIKLEVYYKGSSTAWVTKYLGVKIIPILETPKDIYHRFRVDLTASYLARDISDNGYKDAFQVEIFGKGKLAKDSDKYLEFRALFPNQFDLVAFGGFDEYYATYKDEKIYAHLGDKIYQSSFLSEFARFARGAEFGATLKKLQMNVFYAKPRFFNAIESLLNTSATYSFNKNNKLTYGFLRKELTDSISNIQYLRYQTKITKNVNVEAEYSTSSTEGVTDNAVYLNANATFKKLNANASFLRAGKDFGGFFNNTTFFNANVNYQVTPKVRVQFFGARDARNLEQDTIFENAPQRDRLEAGINYQSKDFNLAGFYGSSRNKDRFSSQRFSFEEDYFRFNLSKKISFFTLDLEAILAKTNNLLFSSRSNSSQYTANVGFTKFKTAFRFFASHIYSNRFQEENIQQNIFGLRAFGNLSKNLNYSLMYQSSYEISDLYRDRNLFELAINRTVKRSTLRFISRYSLFQGSSDNRDFSLSVSCTVPLFVPIQKIAEYGTLEGYVVHNQSSNVKGVKLKLGTKETLTDSKGYYKFTNIVPGKHYLSIDQLELDLNTITLENLPKEIEIKEEKNYYDIQLTQGVNIEGIIKFVTDDGAINLKNYNKESIIIEVANNQEVYRKVCTVLEPFSFINLKPGTWTLKVYRNGLDKQLKVKKKIYNFTLLSGDTKTLSIHLIKKKKVIQFQENTIKLQLKNR